MKVSRGAFLGGRAVGFQGGKAGWETKVGKWVVSKVGNQNGIPRWEQTIIGKCIST